MRTMRLKDMRCVPCEGGLQPMAPKAVEAYLKRLPRGWSSPDGRRIAKTFRFKGYPDAVAFVNRVALVAQEEGHHPDMRVGYSRVEVEVWTHAIGGLSESDFILAAKMEA